MADYATKKVFYVSNPDNEDEYKPSNALNHSTFHRPPQHYRASPSQPTFDSDLISPGLSTSYPPHHPQRVPMPYSPDISGSTPPEDRSPPHLPSLHHISSSVDLQYRYEQPSRPQPIPTSQSYRDRTLDILSPRQVNGSRQVPSGSRPPKTDPKRSYVLPSAPVQDVASPSTSAPLPEKIIFATTTGENYQTVNITEAKSSLQIRELILNRLNIFDEDEHHPFLIYKTEIGCAGIGEPLSNDHMWSLCREQGDSKGSLKFFVSISPTSSQSLPQIQSTESYPAPPLMSPIPPLRLHKKPQRSRNGSFSSQSDTPLVEGGYEADGENNKYSARGRNTSQPNSTSQGSHRRPTDQTSSSPGERPWARNQAHNPPYVTPPAPPPLSPTQVSFPDEPPTRYPPHIRSGSDSATDAEMGAKVAAEQHPDSLNKQSRRDLPPTVNLQSQPSRETLTGNWDTGRPQPIRTVDDLDRTSASRSARSMNKNQRAGSPLHPRSYPPRQPQGWIDLSRPSPASHGGKPVSSAMFNVSGSRPSRIAANPTSLRSPKSAGNLRTPQISGQRPRLPTGPTIDSSSSATAKPGEPSRSVNRHIPFAETSSYSGGSRYGSAGLASPGIDLYQRPPSSLGDTASSPVHATRMQSPTYLDTGDIARSPRAPSPIRPTHAGGPRPRPAPHSDRSDRSSDIQSGPETSNTTPPRTPVSPGNGPDHHNGFFVEPESPALSDNPMRDSRLNEPTLKPEDHPRYIKILGSSTSEDVPRSHQLPPLPPTPNFPPPLPVARPFNEEEEEEESDGGGGTWIVPPTSGPKSPRPPLTVQIDPGTPSSSSSTTVTRSNRAPEVHQKDYYLADPSRQTNTTMVATSDDDDNWATRPLPENIYDHLEKYFSKQVLDKPINEASSGDTSPTSLEPSGALPPVPHAGSAMSNHIATATVVPNATVVPHPPVAERGKLGRGKKSIRVVAQEHKDKIDRTSKASDKSYANILRKRSTKLWGSRVEEVTTHGRNVSSPESPSGGPTTFKWVRGELIGKGTYGRVYLALNATTGEMIAVKQVELPQTASDKADSRQHTVVQALKSESETLRDLDHPNIVQYLGFEETPTNLSIFLEYVPGGSVGSCLLKHGKFDDLVTRSFTAQILGGLEYLHSKGILHRDLKADNILVEMTGVCKISDFGISKRTEDVHGGAHTAMQGTVFWMAPEVINTQKSGYNNKIDIWSVGCVVLEMWAGMRPWMGEEMLTVMFKLYQSKQPPPVPEDVVLSPEANDFRMRCFAINPDDRPSAAELRRDPYLILPPDWIFTAFT